jgi:ketohexokinase
LLQGNGYLTSEDCLRAQAALTRKAYILHPACTHRMDADLVFRSLLCCTWGHEGAAVLELPALVYRHSPAYTEPGHQIVECVLSVPLRRIVLTPHSTIGAGDTFIAGILFGLICHRDDWSLWDKLDFAIKLAGRKVVQEGFSGLGKLMQNAL